VLPTKAHRLFESDFSPLIMWASNHIRTRRYHDDSPLLRAHARGRFGLLNSSSRTKNFPFLYMQRKIHTMATSRRESPFSKLWLQR
jgi:hypothetical protein